MRMKAVRPESEAVRAKFEEARTRRAETFLKRQLEKIDTMRARSEESEESRACKVLRRRLEKIEGARKQRLERMRVSKIHTREQHASLQLRQAREVMELDLWSLRRLENARALRAFNRIICLKWRLNRYEESEEARTALRAQLRALQRQDFLARSRVHTRFGYIEIRRDRDRSRWPIRRLLFNFPAPAPGRARARAVLERQLREIEEAVPRWAEVALRPSFDALDRGRTAVLRGGRPSVDHTGADWVPDGALYSTPYGRIGFLTAHCII